MTNRRYLFAFVLTLATLLAPKPASAYTLGIGQTFGSDNYSGTRVPFQALATPLGDDHHRRLEIDFEMDSYKDDLVASRFWAFEPKLKVLSDGDGSLLVSARWVPPTDTYRQFDFGIEIHYTVFQKPHSDLKKPSLVEELSVGGSLRRRSHGDSLNADRTARALDIDLGETALTLEGAFVHQDWNVPKPNVRIRMQKSFYSQIVLNTDRGGQMTTLFDLTPFVQGYVAAAVNASVYWNVGRPGGFTLEPKVYYTFASFEGSGLSGNALGVKLSAALQGFGVFAAGELYSLTNAATRTFLTLGASFSF